MKKREVGEKKQMRGRNRRGAFPLSMVFGGMAWHGVAWRGMA